MAQPDPLFFGPPQVGVESALSGEAVMGTLDGHRLALAAALGVEPPGDDAQVPSWRWHLVLQGCSLKVVQELMGHHSVTMTERYAHVGDDQLVAAVDALDRLGESGEHR